MGKKLKLLKALENLSNPEKMLKAMLPITGRFLIDVFANFPYSQDGKKETVWKIAIFFKELEENENPKCQENATLGELLNTIPLGELNIHMEVVTWKAMECIGIFINPKQ